MYICVKFSLKNMNSDLCFPHSISTYTCGVTIAPRICSYKMLKTLISFKL